MVLLCVMKLRPDMQNTFLFGYLAYCIELQA